ncbi:RHS repeat-associated core domain-containing protein [Paenimyroides aquimaris]|uniref:RHS repeat-associated core domain-containing protein n=1 Tax=Paenimyroides marinum TaxID=1159016 RepID=A0A1H6LPY0_9FLAO|nr:RHS repeat-associated core domain-containing protein [Paenimyroides aquimaris]SEH90713.1 RHS repeat-associated core domain-containing protein [Paenimyroides aquimaris]
MMVEHNQSTYYKDPYPTTNTGSYDNKWKFNGKELDDATQQYYYGQRYYDPRISIFVSTDPLLTDYPNYTPYHYVHQNPINLIDPTGMSADGWIESYTNDGQTMLTYDAEIDTKEQAIKKGYKNVSSVSETLHYNGANDGEYYTLNKDGSVYNNNTESSVDVGFHPIRTGDGVYISENNQLKSLSSGLQDGGDALTYAGLGLSITGVGAPEGGVLMAVGGYMNLAGTGIEAVYMINQGQFWEGITKIAISYAFTRTSKLGVKAAEKSVGKGIDNGTKTIIEGTNMTIEKTIGKDTEDYINKKIK